MTRQAEAVADRRGFTLIELLIVVVIIGILAAVAIPKYAATRGNAKVAVLRSDLRNMASAQEAYFSDNLGYYSGSLPTAALLYAPSTGVTITITEGDASGWSATAATTGIARTCAIFSGAAAPVAPASQEGIVACDAP